MTLTFTKKAREGLEAAKGEVPPPENSAYLTNMAIDPDFRR